MTSPAGIIINSGAGPKLRAAMRLGKEGKLFIGSDLDNTLTKAKTDPRHIQAEESANVDVVNDGLGDNERVIISLRQIKKLFPPFVLPFAPDVVLVGSNGRKWRSHSDEIKEHEDASRCASTVTQVMPIAEQRLKEAGFLLPGLTHFDTDFDGYGFALYYRALAAEVKEPKGSHSRTELNEMERVLDDIKRRLPEIFGGLESEHLVLEKGIGMQRLMGPGFTKERAVTEQWRRSQEYRKEHSLPALSGAVYFGDDVDTDDAGWRAIHRLTAEGHAQVGLAVGVANPGLSTEDRAKLLRLTDVVLPNITAVGSFMTTLATGRSVDRWDL
jgi:hypothetical protein